MTGPEAIGPQVLGPEMIGSITTHLVDKVLVLHGAVAYLIVGLLCFGEAAVMLGFVLPGETAVIIGGVLASQAHVDLLTMVVVVAASAIVGDSVGYEVGKHLGPRLLSLKLFDRRRAAIERGQAFLCRHGAIAVFVGRFTALFRAMVPGLAGMSGMSYPKFLAANALGGIIWGTLFTLLGYFVGQSIESLTGTASLILLGTLVLIALGLHLHGRRKERRLAGQVPPGDEKEWSQANHLGEGPGRPDEEGAGRPEERGEEGHPGAAAAPRPSGQAPQPDRLGHPGDADHVSRRPQIDGTDEVFLPDLTEGPIEE